MALAAAVAGAARANQGLDDLTHMKIADPISGPDFGGLRGIQPRDESEFIQNIRYQDDYGHKGWKSYTTTDPARAKVKAARAQSRKNRKKK